MLPEKPWNGAIASIGVAVTFLRFRPATITDLLEPVITDQHLNTVELGVLIPQLAFEMCDHRQKSTSEVLDFVPEWDESSTPD